MDIELQFSVAKKKLGRFFRSKNGNNSNQTQTINVYIVVKLCTEIVSTGKCVFSAKENVSPMPELLLAYSHTSRYVTTRSRTNIFYFPVEVILFSHVNSQWAEMA